MVVTTPPRSEPPAPRAPVHPTGPRDRHATPAPGAHPRDPAAEATNAQPVAAERPEQQQTEHDTSGAFDWKKPAPLTPALKDQPNGGRITGFEFSRDPLGADQPFQTFDEVMKKESAAKRR